MTATVDCSVLVPVLNEERYIESSVTAMRRQRFPGELEFVFADGGSTDRTREILDELARQDPRVRVFDNPGRSVSAGLNVCLSHARGRWALRMDAHTDYPDDYALLGVERLQRGGTRWVSGPQVPRGHGPVSRAVAAALGAPMGRGGSRKWGDPASPSDRAGPSDPAGRSDPPAPAGAGDPAGPAGDEFELDTGVFTGVWERATLLEYGGWDERWPRNSDSEMAARFIERGEKLICLPAMGAEYVPRDSIRGLWRQYLGYGEFRALTALRHPTAMRASHLLAPGVVLATAAAIVAPRGVRRAARLGIAAYGVSLAAAGLRARGRVDSTRTAALLPVVLVTMHFGHGIGQLKAWVKYGPPLRAFAHVAGLGGLVSSGEPGAEPVYAPSLRLDAADAPA